MKCKDTWTREVVVLIVHFFLIIPLNGQGIWQNLQAGDHTGALRLREIGNPDDSLRYALVAHAASMSRDPDTDEWVHTLELAQRNGFNVVKVFSPEHGFAGSFSAGEKVEGEAIGFNLPLVSLYGAHKKPHAEDLQDVDAVLFDLQDIGVRFYTYISTLTYVMEACAEFDKPLIILDRPNPFANVIDGPVLDSSYSSFVGLHPVPVLYGMTIGEYAQMVKGEGWIKHSNKLQLIVVPCVNYHRETVELHVPPSPNLPNAHSIALYPSLCFFEATPVSVGRGTSSPFEVYGAPWLADEGSYQKEAFSFIPLANQGAKHPKFEKEVCVGVDLRQFPTNPTMGLHLEFLQHALQEYTARGLDKKAPFFSPFMDKLAGGASLKEALLRGEDIDAIKDSWQPYLLTFKMKRRKYLLYEEVGD